MPEQVHNTSTLRIGQPTTETESHHPTVVLNGQIQRALDLDTVELEGDGRTLVARLLRWNIENTVTDDGVTFYNEEWVRGAFANTIKRAEQLGRKWPLFVNHKRSELPAGAVAQIAEREDGPWMTARISRTRHGDEIIELVRDGALPGVSLGAAVVRSRRTKSAVQRLEVALKEVSLTPFEQLIGAEVMALRSDPEVVRPKLQELDEYLANLKRPV